MFYLVRYHREAITTDGNWVSVMDSGFVTNDCTLSEVQSVVAEVVGWHDGKTSRISKPEIRCISDEERARILQSDLCFWSGQLARMAGKAAEAFDKL